jgi:hypothetical protein
MANEDLDRVRADLAVIRTAAGLGSMWGRQDLRTNLLLAAAGAAAIGWALAPHGHWPVLGLLAFLVPVVEWLRAGTREGDDGRDTERAREDFRQSCRALWLAMPISALYLWCRYVGLTPFQFLGIATFLVGVVLFGPAVGDRGQRPLLPWAVTLMVGGLLVPLGIAPVIAVIAGAIALGGLISAAAVAWELRQGRAGHDAS